MTENSEIRRVIVFDGVCNLCNASVNWIIDRDLRKTFLFGSLQSQEVEQMLAKLEWKGDPQASVLLIDGNTVRSESDAALSIASGLGWPWKAFGVFRLVPRFLRDAIYRWVARNRYRWFGRTDTCRVPSPDLASRFLASS